MSRNSIKSQFKFNKQQKSGIFFLLLFICIFQVVYFLVKSFPVTENLNTVVVDVEYQDQLEDLRVKSQNKDTFQLYPFNPNYISDFKGYTLGMSIEEINRLHAFRAKNKYVNSSLEFQKVTLVSDSLLELVSPYFKFPEWVGKNKKTPIVGGNLAESGISKTSLVSQAGLSSLNSRFKDLNTATAEDLKDIKGIGSVLSQRIVKFRDLLGGFVKEEQLGHVYGLEPEVTASILKRFKILERPSISKININIASPGEISKLVYIKYEVAARIVAFRDVNGGIDSFDELVGIEDFPSEKLDIIELYLQL